MLRLVGNRFGPVIRNGPPRDSAARTIEWSHHMGELAERRRPKSGRFTSDPERATGASRDMLEH